MTDLRGSGIGFRLPTGWDGTIVGADVAVPLAIADQVTRPTVAHLANFPLGPVVEDFGADVIETMTSGDVLVVLFEFDRASAGTALFEAEGVPPIRSSDFDRDHLHHEVPGRSAVQRFFHVGDRAFCLYVVAGSHLDRADVIPQVNQLLNSIEIDQ